MWTKLGGLNKNPNTPIKFALGIFQLGLGFLIFASTAHFIDATWENCLSYLYSWGIS